MRKGDDAKNILLDLPTTGSFAIERFYYVDFTKEFSFTEEMKI